MQTCMCKLCKLDIARESPLHMDLCSKHDIKSVLCRTSVEFSVELDKQAVQLHPYCPVAQGLTGPGLCCALMRKKYSTSSAVLRTLGQVSGSAVIDF